MAEKLFTSYDNRLTSRGSSSECNGAEIWDVSVND